MQRLVVTLHRILVTVMEKYYAPESRHHLYIELGEECSTTTLYFIEVAEACHQTLATPRQATLPSIRVVQPGVIVRPIFLPFRIMYHLHGFAVFQRYIDQCSDAFAQPAGNFRLGMRNPVYTAGSAITAHAVLTTTD